VPLPGRGGVVRRGDWIAQRVEVRIGDRAGREVGAPPLSQRVFVGQEHQSIASDRVGGDSRLFLAPAQCCRERVVVRHDDVGRLAACCAHGALQQLEAVSGDECGDRRSPQFLIRRDQCLVGEDCDGA